MEKTQFERLEEAGLFEPYLNVPKKEAFNHGFCVYHDCDKNPCRCEERIKVEIGEDR